MTARLRTIHLAEPLGGLGLEEKNDIASMLGNQPWNNLLAPHALGEHCPFTPAIVSRLEGLRDSVKSSWRCHLSEEDSEKDRSGREELEEMVRKMLSSGQIDPEALSKIAGLGANPAMMGQMFSQLRNLMSDSEGPINWKMAENQAMELAKKDESKNLGNLETEISNAFEIARLWLSEVTQFSTAEQPKLLRRSVWVQDAMPLFAELSEPVASSMAKALSENIVEAMPEELANLLGPASKFIGNAGAAIFAMQLGQAMGKLSTQTLSATEIGIPISSRPGLVTQNVGEFIKDIETPKSEIVIYLAIRELAISSLYASNRWLRDQITTQVREFASGLRVEISGIQEMVEQIDPQDPESMNRVMEATAMMSQRTEDQETALVRIETMLALIDGWADAIAEEAGKRLPTISSVVELASRKRATEGAAEKTFAILLGLELQPRLRREAKAMWQEVTKLGGQKRDQLWSHPDQLPSVEEISNPSLVLARLERSDDDFDEGLRKLLDN